MIRGELSGATTGNSSYPAEFTRITLDQYTANDIQIRMVLGGADSNIDLFEKGCLTIPPAGTAKTNKEVKQFNWAAVPIGQRVTVFARILDAQEFPFCYWEDFQGPGSLKPITFVAE